MIRLDVREYCSACCDFDPEVTRPVRETLRFDDDRKDIVFQSDTIVRCSHAKRCEAIKRYLEQQINSAKG